LVPISLSNAMWPGPRPTHRTEWHVDPFSRLATRDMDWGLCHLGELGPHLTQCCGGRASEAYLYAKFYLDPYNFLVTIHQRHRQAEDRTDRQTGRQIYDRTDNGPIA